MGLIRFILIGLCIYLSYRLLVRFVLPLLGRYAMKKAAERLQDQVKRNADKQQGKKRVYQDSEMTIHKTQDAKNDNGASNDDDEYVDFEEIKS